jgi:hypothetical protein
LMTNEVLFSSRNGSNVSPSEVSPRIWQIANEPGTSEVNPGFWETNQEVPQLLLHWQMDTTSSDMTTRNPLSIARKSHK